MAWMNQNKKAAIAVALKKVMPKGWKFTLAVRHHSTIVCTISEAPFDLIRAFKESEYFNPETATHVDVNPYHFRTHLEDECVADVMEKIFGALNLGNWNRSDIQIDYFDVGHYVDLQIGRWNKPFVVREAEPVPA